MLRERVFFVLQYFLFPLFFVLPFGAHCVRPVSCVLLCTGCTKKEEEERFSTSVVFLIISPPNTLFLIYQYENKNPEL